MNTGSQETLLLQKKIMRTDYDRPKGCGVCGHLVCGCGEFAVDLTTRAKNINTAIARFAGGHLDREEASAQLKKFQEAHEEERKLLEIFSYKIRETKTRFVV